MSNISDRGIALNALAAYQRASLIPSVNALVDSLESRYPGFLDLWGKGIRPIPQNKLYPKLEALAEYNGLSYPTRPELNDVAQKASQGIVSVSSAVVEGSKQAGAELASAAGTALKSGMFILVLAGIAYLLVATGALKGVRRA